MTQPKPKKDNLDEQIRLIEDHRRSIRALIKEGDFRRYETAAEVEKPNQQFRNDVANSLASFLLDSLIAVTRPTKEHRKKWESYLSALRTAKESAGKLPGENIRPLLESELEEVTTILAAWPNFKRGPQPHWAFRNLVYSLKTPYRKATGRDPGYSYYSHEDRYDGPFVSLVEAVYADAREIVQRGDPRVQLFAPVSASARGEALKGVVDHPKEHGHPTFKGKKGRHKQK